MTGVRLAFYVLYVALGAAIILRLAWSGLRPQMISGLVLGAALMALGIYRLRLYLQMRGMQGR